MRAELVVWAVKVACSTLGWYLMSVSLTLFNKWILGCTNELLEADPEHGCDPYWVASFKFPVTMTCCHMFLKGVISWTTIKLLKLPVPKVTWRAFLYQACPIGASTGLDIACSNYSFLYVTVTFATMVKPCGLLWTCALAICMKLEEPSIRLLSVVGCIFAGVWLASFGETEFSGIGFVFVMLSTLFSAVRWVFTQLMLSSSLSSQDSKAAAEHLATAPTCSKTAGGTSGSAGSGGGSLGGSGLFGSGPVVLLWLISPSATISVMPMIWYTGEGALLAEWFHTEDPTIIMWSAAAVALAALMAFLLLMFELYIVALSSSLSLNVIGTFKEMVTIAFGVLIFGDVINVINGVGVVVTVLGIVLYNHHRYTQMQAKAAAGKASQAAVDTSEGGVTAEAGESSEERKGLLAAAEEDDE